MAFPFSGETFMQNRGKTPERQLLMLPTAEIRPNPNQPRKQFDEKALLELKASIAQTGLIQPLVVRSAQCGYELIAGERRLRACRLLGMAEVPCVVQRASDEAGAVMALVENLQRRDLHYLEEAECYKKLLLRSGLTQEQLAGRIGKSQSFLANKLRLLQLSPTVRHEMLVSGLSERHARAFLRLRDEREQLPLIRRAAEKELTVKETERMVEKALEAAQPVQKKPRMLRLLKDYRLFLNAVKASAEQLRDAGLTVTLTQTDLADGDGTELLVRVTRRESGERGTADAPKRSAL